MKWSCTIRARFFDKKKGVYKPLAPQAKGNSKVVTKQKRIVNSPRAAAFVKECKAAAMEHPPKRLLRGDLWFAGNLYYASPLSDLDPGLIWDALEGIVYENDRQIVAASLYKMLDKNDPRAEIFIEER